MDAVVVGGGPAGSATAARLARLGHRVLLLDREEFPRRKPCGECVNPAAVAALRALGAWERVEALRPRPLAGWTLRAGPACFHGDFGADEGGVAVPRAALDLALLEHAAAAGVEVRTGVRVVELLREGGAVRGVRTAGGEEVPARAVVGADGLRSVIARRLGVVRRPPRLRKVALTAHLQRLSLPARGELRVFPDGCLGIAAVADDTANVTVVLQGERIAAAAGDPAGCFDRVVAEQGIEGRRVDPVLATGPFDFPVRAASGAGFVLVGDAAGYFDPFTGQGIFRALRGAELAAAVLGRALAGGDLSSAALAPYGHAHRRAFGPGERLQRLVEFFVARPRWMAWALRRLAAAPEVGDALIRATGDLLPPRALLDPVLLLRLAR